VSLGLRLISIPKTYNKLLALISKAKVMSQYFKTGAQLEFRFEFTATNRIPATAKFIMTYKTA